MQEWTLRKQSADPAQAADLSPLMALYMYDVKFNPNGHQDLLSEPFAIRTHDSHCHLTRFPSSLEYSGGSQVGYRGTRTKAATEQYHTVRAPT
jgi:hypothetical protein